MPNLSTISRVVVTLLSLSVVTLFTSSNALSDYARQNVRNHFGDDRLIALPIAVLRENEKVRKILNEHSYDDVGHHQGSSHLKLSPEAVAALNNEGIEFTDHTEEFVSNMERNLNSENFFCTEGAEACASKSQDDFHSMYQPMDAIHQRFENMAAENNLNWETLGISYEGREQKVLWIGDQTKPLVFYFCAIHAREWITPMYCTYMAETLLDASNENSQFALDVFSFAIMPVANPDGYEFSYYNNSAWRKTRKPNLGSDCIGTDPNRNYAVGWGGPGTSTDACSNVYHGRAPFDQPCTANIKNFTDTYQDRLIHVNDVHAYGEYWMSPWAGTVELPDEVDYDHQDTCNRAVRDAILDFSGLEFKIGPVATTIYEAAGGSVDYFYGVNGVVYSVTYEARGGGLSGLAGFRPPPENIMPSNQELFVGMIAALRCINTIEFTQTSYPTANPTGCVDMSPNFISFPDGSPAPCEILGDYCPVYEVVRERCPATCNTCGSDRNSFRYNIEGDVVIEQELGLSGTAIALISACSAMGGFVAALLVAVIFQRKVKVSSQESSVQV